MSKNRACRIPISAVLLITLVCMLVSAGEAQTFTVEAVIPNTPGQIDYPASSLLLQGWNGQIYASASGGLLSTTTAGTLSLVTSATLPQFFPTLGLDGNIYSALYFDRIGCGEVWQSTPAGTSTQLASICGTYGNGPIGAPIEHPNGIFYGTSSEIPSGGAGTIYSMTSAGALTLLHAFSGTDGATPVTAMVVGTDGNLYGGTRNGGTNNDGVLFRITPGGTFTVLHNFAGTDGRDLEQPMILGRDGNLYGVTQSGGTDNIGVAFKLTNSGTYTVIYNFLTPYSVPTSQMIQGTNGIFYGVLGQGNGLQPGWLYSLTTTGTFTILHEFCQVSGCTDGIAPSTPLIQATDGNFYGFTVHGGNESFCSGNGCGVFYKLGVGLRPFALLQQKSGIEGSQVSILGQGFASTSVVTFGGVAATAVSETGGTYISATVPAGALTGNVTVTTGSTTLTSSQPFSVKPTFLSLSPTSGPVGTPVTLTGTGLTQTTKVTFNGTSATFTVNSDTQVTTTVPTGATSGRIGITTKGGTVQSTSRFTVN